MSDPDRELIREGESLDDLQNGYFVIQSRRGFRFGADAVLLSWYASVSDGRGGKSTKKSILDMGTGTGVIPILLAARTDAPSITGLEIQEESAAMAARSVRYNHLEDRVHIVRGDIRQAVSIFGTASFDTVVSNPPYMISRHGLVNPDEAAAVARHELLCSFDELADQTARVLRDRGHFYLIHRPFRLAEILHKLIVHGLEPKRMRLVYPYIDREPNLVLIEAVKGGRSRITVEKPLIMYERPGVYTQEIREIYWGETQEPDCSEEGISCRED